MTAIEKLEEIATEIAEQHANGICNHHGSCELVYSFIQYLQAKPEDIQDVEDWIDGDYEELYDRIFSGNFNIADAPEEHVSDVELWKKIVAETNA